MVKGIMTYVVGSILCFSLLSCTSTQTEGNEKPKLTQEQQAAFDALNRLQINTDQRNRLYSTFANTDQACYPPDTSYIISQSQLLGFMEQFVSKHCQNLSVKVRDELVASSVLAQESYTILYCNGTLLDMPYEKEPPMTGTWVLPNILGRRDVLLVW